MNKTELQELLDAVEMITDDLYKQQIDWEQLFMPTLEVVFGNAYIKFAGVVIWTEEGDDREWIEEKRITNDGDNVETIEAHYEDMEPYLRKKVMSLLDSVKKIQL